MAVRDWVYIKVRPNKQVKIDRSDLARVSQHSWRVVKGTTGRLRVVTSIREKTRVKQITLGTFIMRPPKGKQVYPRRFNQELDYRRGNLIVCTLKERQRLLPKNRKSATSKYRGVTWVVKKAHWIARIKTGGKTIYLGSFEREDDAALAYNEAARKHFGKVAYQNPVGRRYIPRD